MKKLLIGLVAILVLLVAALFVAPPLLGNSLVKPRIVAAVKEATGRDLEIGDLSLAVLPTVKVSLRDLRLANAENGTSPDMVKLGRLDFELALFPLIAKQVLVERLVVSDLAADLEVNAAGAANWVFPKGPEKAEAAAPAEPEAGAGLANLRLGDVRLENARVTYHDERSGQSIEAADINVTAQLSDIAAKLALSGGLVLNGKPIKINASVDSPQALMTGEPAKLAAAVTSELVNLRSDLELAQKPQPAVDGTATVEVGSVGQLLAWLQQPLPADQPDPGPVKLSATFKTEGAKVLLQEAVIKGQSLDLEANGSFESVDGLNKVALTVESGVLDIDRYLPPPAAAAPADQERGSQEGHARSVSPIEAIPDQPLDLSPLRQTVADIKVSMAGIKAAGYEVGALALTVESADGKLRLDLSRLALYGGDVTGKLDLDASGDGLGVEADFALDKVDLGALSAVASAGEPPVAGIASGRLTASASGATPRALVRGLKGGLVFKVGKVDVKNAAAGAISGVDLTVDLPGVAQPPSLTGQVIYNKQKVSLNVGLDPLDKVLAGEIFALQAHLDADLLKLSYDGTVQQRPLPGLDGRFNLASPSVGKLAAWLGKPLGPKQPDPGPLKIDAQFKSEGETVVLEKAVIEGKDLKAEARGRVDVEDAVTKVAFDLKAGMLDIDRYLPPQTPAKTVEADRPAGPSPANPLEAIPDEPFDLAALRGHEANITIALDGLRAAGFELGKTAVTVKLAGGKLGVEIGQLALYGGAVKGRVDLDGSGDALGLDSDLSVTGLAVGDLARAAGVQPAPLDGVLSGAIKAKGQGANPRALVTALSADLGLQMRDAGLAAMPGLAIASLDASLVVPGLDRAANGRVAATLNGRPLEAKLTLDSAAKAMRGEAFATTLAVTSKLMTASLDGRVQQQPVPGLDGTIGLDVASLGQLAAWLGEPLPDGQPDPGPLKIDAKLAADGQKVAIQSASITGKAAQATASGSYDGSGGILRFDGKLDVAKLDLNAYLPPQGKAPATAAAAPKGGPAGWSEEPIGAFSFLKQAEGQAQVKLANVLYRQVQLQSADAQVSLAGGVLKADLTGVQLSPGQVAASAVVDGSGDATTITYQAKVEGVESKPFLESFADMDFLSGKLTFETKGRARGDSQKEIVGSLNGDGSFTFLDGAIEGFDLAGTLRNVGQLGMASGGEKPKTDFTELSGSFTITDGVLVNKDLKMLAPLVRVTGAGQVPLPPRTLDYNAEAKLVASLEGQGGSDALAGLPIPVHAYGPWDKLSYKIDYESMFKAAAADPARLANLPAELKDKASELGVDLPIPGLGGSESGGLKKLLQGGAGGESGGGLGGVVEGLLGGGKKSQPPSEEAPASGEESATPSQEEEQKQPSIVPDLGKQLKGLFN